MAVLVSINGAKRITVAGATVLLVDVTVGTSHQLIPFNEAELTGGRDVQAQIDYIGKSALAAVAQETRITRMPEGMADIRSSSLVEGQVPMDGFGVAQVTKSTDYTLTTADYAVWVNATSGNRVITLPVAAGAGGSRYEIKKIDTSTNTVTVTPQAGETIDGASSRVLQQAQQSVTLTSDGTNWHAS